MKCAELPLNVRIITQVVGEFCAYASFYKFVFCGRRFPRHDKKASLIIL
jgi:hypothetical protein